MNASNMGASQDVEDKIRRLFDGLPGEVCLNFLENDDRNINFVAKGFDAGEKVFKAIRRINLVNREAHHDLFVVEPGYEGGRIGARMLSNAVYIYRKLGVRYIRIKANIDVGGYAWARYGFVPEAVAWTALQLEIKALPVYSVLTQDIIRIVNVIFSMGPEGISMLSGLDKVIEFDGVCQSVGKHLLLWRSWDGVFDVNNQMQLAQLRHFSERTDERA